MPRFPASLAILVALGAARSSATTIVAIWTPSKLVISGDSVLNLAWTGSDGAPRRKSAKDCKIRRFGSSYVAAAGNYHIQTAGFDLWESAARACGAAARVDICAARLKAELNRALRPAAGIHDIHLTLVVAGVDDGVPSMEHITLVGAPNGRLDLRSEVFKRPRQTKARVILGDRDAIDRYERSTPVGGSAALEDEAASLVKIEARALPGEVGPPFSTLVIDARGGRWTNPGCCVNSCSK